MTKMAEDNSKVFMKGNAKETLHTLLEMSKLLNTGLEADTLALCIRLIENGVNPEALAFAIRELRLETCTNSKT